MNYFLIIMLSLVSSFKFFNLNNLNNVNKLKTKLKYSFSTNIDNNLTLINNSL